MRKLLVPIQGDYVAPRFDLATEIMILRYEKGMKEADQRTIIMERPSDEALCQMVVEENVTDLVCGGVAEVHYNFLVWKKVNVIDAVIGSWKRAVEKLLSNDLKRGEILTDGDENLTL